jgi:hypothetical protein
MDAQACDQDYLLTIVLLPRIHQHDAPLVQNLIFAGNRTLHQAALAATHQSLEIDVILPGSPDIPLGPVEKKNKDKLERIMKYVSNFVSCCVFADVQSTWSCFSRPETRLQASFSICSSFLHYPRSLSTREREDANLEPCCCSSQSV